ncbi:hypothetical protein, partial [Kitasatospora sp. NPDC047058]|uniref:hypothetical protein n=1 Tax=Kitasatospora sp. NPDC047058 TaxID=3155620 RepID=UPI0033D77C98
MHRPEITPPDWLLHPLRRQTGPFPWGGVLRGALGMGPLLAAAARDNHRPGWTTFLRHPIA